MTTLTLYADHDASHALARHTEFTAIREALAEIGVGFQRWQTEAPLPPDASTETVLAAYAEQVEELKRRYAFESVDVASIHPEHPQAEAARGKFLAEHTHDDFEIRFFVEGSGAFYIRKHGRVYMTVCTAGDLIELPANTTHWFDMGPRPYFKAIRFFTKAEGWVGHFTGDEIAKRFPAYSSAA
jgi:1,2-dihydroxy-3-keto-5-methylthiopentene dioxygenase